MLRRITQYLITGALLCGGCSKVIEDEFAISENSELSFSEDFDFQTHKTVLVTTGDSGNPFELYYLDNFGNRHYLGNYFHSSESISVTMPTFVEELEYTNLKAEGSTTGKITLDSGQKTAQVPSESSRGRTSNQVSCVDHLYAVNSNSGFYKIDISTDQFEASTLPNLPGGSIANALDQENGVVYVNVGSTLYKYYIETEQFEVAFTSNPFNGSYPRFEYRQDTFYIGNSSTMYTVKASTNEVIQKYELSGFVNSNAGGDLAFDSEGTLYLACFSGLYKFSSLDSEAGIANIVRISAENFPYQLTSMAIDREDRIFVGTNDANSRLIEISKEDGAYTIVNTYNYKINDLTAWKCAFSEEDFGGGSDNDGDGVVNEEDDDMDNDGIIDEKDDDVDGDGVPNEEDDDMDGDGTPNDEDSDIDGDGVINPLDEYPNDPIASGSIFTPSKLGYGTIAFEDNWPSKGDYDFNDLVVRYKVTSKINKDNKAIQMEIELRLVAAGGEYNNGFGIELPIAEAVIESVTGHNAPAGMLNERGLELGQVNPTIIAFTNALGELGGGNVINADPAKTQVAEKVYNIVVDLSELVDVSELANAPYNPFIFINSTRGRECHLKGMSPTNLLNPSFLTSNDDDSNVSEGRYYVSENNVPFAINISHAFRYPIEGTRIDKAYNHFLNWGESAGQVYTDWYTDASGYRNTSKIYTK